MKKTLLIVLTLVSAAWCHAQSPVLWGLTSYGGKDTAGVIFKVTSGGNLTAEYSFNKDTDGIMPSGSLIEANDGLLYGLTPYSQPTDGGALFSYDIATGKETILHFLDPSDGEGPYGSLIQATNNLLYGLTTNEGTGDAGTIISYDIATKTLTDVYDFADQNDGYEPKGSLLQVNDTMLYGMTYGGGANGGNAGEIFSFNTSSNTYTPLYNFLNDEDDGGFPVGSLILGKDSLLYGLTPQGGFYNSGVIFYYDISTNTDWDLWDFGSSNSDGITPNGSLLQVNDSMLYGTTSAGGTTGNGTVFSYNIKSGKEIILHQFAGAGDDQFPQGSLIQASDGLLYGTTLGGDDALGSVFSYNTSTGVTTTVASCQFADGNEPRGDLLEDDATGINRLASNNRQLTVYPNPTTGQFILNLPGNHNGNSVEIYNVMGESVYQSVVSNSQNTVDLSSEPTGLYVVYLKTGEGIEVGKVVVVR